MCICIVIVQIWMQLHKLDLSPKKKPKRNLKILFRKACMNFMDFIVD